MSSESERAIPIQRSHRRGRRRRAPLRLVHPGDVPGYRVSALRFQLPAVPAVIQRRPRSSWSPSTAYLWKSSDVGPGRAPTTPRFSSRSPQNGAKVIGVDIGFFEPDREVPENDRALAEATREAGNVVYPVVIDVLENRTRKRRLPVQNDPRHRARLHRFGSRSHRAPSRRYRSKGLSV